MKHITITALLAAAALAGGCYEAPTRVSQSTSQDARAQARDPHAGALPGAPQATAGATGGGVAGRVLETMDAGQYTYVRLATARGEQWAAGPQTPVAVGDEVSLVGAMAMSQFHSDTLDRTFDRILFASAIRPAGGQDPHAMPGLGAGAGAATAGGLTGRVLETMDAGKYTYVRLATGEGDLWAAGPQTAVAVGDEVRLVGAMPMSDFHSETLDRTFDSILFTSAIERAAAPDGAGSAGPLPDPHGSIGSKAPGVEVEAVERPEGGRTIAEIWAAADELPGGRVTVRGTVVKFNSGILGRNWLHIRDGSGGEGTNDLTVTTQDSAAVGDVVTVNGMLSADADFGAGYRYPLIVEDATVTKE